MSASSSAARVVGVVALLLAGGLAVAGQRDAPAPVVAAAPVVATAAPVAVAPSPAPTPASASHASATTAPVSAGRLVVADLLDVEIVEEVAPADGVVRPVTYTGAAEVVGLPGQQARVIALHSGPGSAPGTPLSVRDGSSTVQVGDPVWVDGVSYTVESAGVHDKGDAAWAAVGKHLSEDGALVVITCRPTSASPAHSPANVVIVARRT